MYVLFNLLYNIVLYSIVTYYIYMYKYHLDIPLHSFGNHVDPQTSLSLLPAAEGEATVQRDFACPRTLVRPGFYASEVGVKRPKKMFG